MDMVGVVQSKKQKMEDPLEKEFRGDSHLKHCEIMVIRENGTLILTGTVASFYLKQLAQELAKRVSNGVQVKNELVVS